MIDIFVDDVVLDVGTGDVIKVVFGAPASSPPLERVTAVSLDEVGVADDPFSCPSVGPLVGLPTLLVVTICESLVAEAGVLLGSDCLLSNILSFPVAVAHVASANAVQTNLQ